MNCVLERAFGASTNGHPCTRGVVRESRSRTASPPLLRCIAEPVHALWVQSLGIDLGGHESPTGLAWVTWDPAPRVTRTELCKVPNERLGRLADEVVHCLGDENNWVGVDAPFGFPDGFVSRIEQMQARAVEPIANADIVWRHTDHHVRKGFGRYPLSTVTQMITGNVVRCADLLHQVETDCGWHIRPTSYESRVIETYPIACLYEWEVVGRDGNVRRAPDPSKAEADSVRATPEDLVDKLLTVAPSLTDRLDGADGVRLRTSRDVVDAVVCALAAGLVAAAGPSGPTWPNHQGGEVDVDVDVLDREGWIHIPRTPKGLSRADTPDPNRRSTRLRPYKEVAPGAPLQAAQT